MSSASALTRKGAWARIDAEKRDRRDESRRAPSHVLFGAVFLVSDARHRRHEHPSGQALVESARRRGRRCGAAGVVLFCGWCWGGGGAGGGALAALQPPTRVGRWSGRSFEVAFAYAAGHRGGGGTSESHTGPLVKALGGCRGRLQQAWGGAEGAHPTKALRSGRCVALHVHAGGWRGRV